MSTSDQLNIVPVHGLPVADLHLSGLLAFILRTVRAGKADPGPPTTLAYVNAHSCNLAARNPEYRDAMLDTDLLYLDGNGPRLAAWLTGHWLPPRMTAADWFDDFCSLSADEGFTFYFLGSPAGVASEAAQRLRAQHPAMEILGTHHGYFRPEEQSEIRAEISALDPDILLLAMGSPTQELWMQEFKRKLSVPLIWCAGGVLDYASGSVPRAPSWMRALGLEWLGRMLIEPRRLAPRYAKDVPLFLLRSFAYAVRTHTRRGPGQHKADSD